MNEFKAAVVVLCMGTLGIGLFVFFLWLVHWVEWLSEYFRFGNADGTWPPWPLKQETDDE